MSRKRFLMRFLLIFVMQLMNEMNAKVSLKHKKSKAILVFVGTPVFFACIRNVWVINSTREHCRIPL